MFSLKKLYLLLFIAASLEARIQKIQHIKHVAQLVFDHVAQKSQENVLVAFDLCNTLFTPRIYQEWGSDHWLDAHAKRLIQQEGIEASKVWAALLPIYYEIQGHPTFALEPVEEGTLQALELIKETAHKTVALTARSISIINQTLKRMHAAGINFTATGFGDEFELTTIQAAYRDGVIFCSGRSKGVALLQVLEKVRYTPVEIIIVDDKESNLLAIERAFITAVRDDIQLTLIHYTHLEDVVNKFTLGDYSENRC